ncbi:glycosyltransferase family 2 protein [Virgibacillus sp. MSP4-1]|uniref:glycosyltransferase family 2 protein n=1 Tax=Virgibacillus sp. MSP4-1 TaxID=2700081 RepID=UPI0003A97D06|nr:glycosyltransferase family 2 protein [Virgibacillus sp. MSP4-1]QHS23505.1 glycosyltransferase family 2 protein [Virgibacillus sp. MSP4-1]
MNQQKVLIIVPCFNEEAVIKNTLQKLLWAKKQMKTFSVDICVVNDGSTDQTAQILDSYREEVVVIHLPCNLGIGGAMQTGYKYACKKGYDYAIQFDADGQHNEKDIQYILHYIDNQQLDMTIGSRFLKKTDYKGSPFRRAGILYFQFFIFVLTGRKITDATSGFRVINRKVIEKFSANYPKDYPEPEVIIDLVKNGYQVEEITVHMNQREGGETSISHIRSLYYMLKVSLSIFMRTIVKE